MTTPSCSGLRTVAAGTAFVAAATAVQLLRQPGVRSWDTVLAEDGAVFLTDALHRPLTVTLLTPYEGYLHVVPRLVAAVAALLPLRDAAAVLTGGAALVVSLLALYVWSVSGQVLRTRTARALLVAALLLLPTGQFETNASINNLHWYLDYACFWAVCTTPGGRRGLAASCVVVLAAVLCDPLAGLLLPVAVWRAVLGRRGRPGGYGSRAAGLLVPGVLLAGLAVQVVAGVGHKPPHRFVPVHLSDLPGTYGLRVAGSMLVSDRFLVRLFVAHGLAFAYLGLAVGVVAVAGAVLGARAHVRPLVLAAAAFSVVLFTVPLLVRGTSIYLDPALVRLDGSRYMVAPALLLVVAVTVAVDSHRDGSGRPVLGPALTAAVLVVLAVGATGPSVREHGPDWGRTVAAAQRRCAPPGRTGPAQVRLPVAPAAPDGLSSSWNVVVPCRRLG